MHVLPAWLARCKDEQVKRKIDANDKGDGEADWLESALSGLTVLLQSR